MSPREPAPDVAELSCRRRDCGVTNVDEASSSAGLVHPSDRSRSRLAICSMQQIWAIDRPQQRRGCQTRPQTAVTRDRRNDQRGTRAAQAHRQAGGLPIRSTPPCSAGARPLSHRAATPTREIAPYRPGGPAWGGPRALLAESALTRRPLGRLGDHRHAVDLAAEAHSHCLVGLDSKLVRVEQLAVGLEGLDRDTR
jgi:hypothetical protein